MNKIIILPKWAFVVIMMALCFSGEIGNILDKNIDKTNFGIEIHYILFVISMIAIMIGGFTKNVNNK